MAFKLLLCSALATGVASERRVLKTLLMDAFDAPNEELTLVQRQAGVQKHHTQGFEAEDWKMRNDHYCPVDWNKVFATRTQETLRACKAKCASSASCVAVAFGANQFGTSNCVLCTDVKIQPTHFFNQWDVYVKPHKCCNKKDPDQHAEHGCNFVSRGSCGHHPHCSWTCAGEEATLVEEGASTAEEPDVNLKLVAESERAASAGSYSGSCPWKKSPTLLYNHITKTGGTAVKELLQAALPKDTWKVEENLEDARLSHQKKGTSFVIGLVRRPCDYMVSWYYQLRSHCDTKADETGHLSCDNQGAKSKLAAHFLDFVNDTGASANHRMSSALADRYGTEDNVHCMMRTHNLKADFIDCMGQYQACGGIVNNETSLDELADKALRKAAGVAREAGRSVGNHPACSELFDKELEAKVLESEQAVVDKYNLETCCSSDQHQ